MKPLPFACTVIAALALTPVLVGTGRPAAAEGPRLRYVSSLYIDEKGAASAPPRVSRADPRAASWSPTRETGAWCVSRSGRRGLPAEPR